MPETTNRATGRRYWGEAEMSEWFRGDLLSDKQRRDWLAAVDLGAEIPPELLDTLPADRRAGKPGAQVLLIGAYWTEGKPAGESVELKPKMTEDLRQFLQAELDRIRESET